MNSTNPTPSQTPIEQPIPPQQPSLNQNASKKKLTWGLICLIGPTALLILSIVVYAIINFFVGSSSESSFVWIVNMLMFLVGAITVLTWLPGVIVGIILLASRNKPQGY